MFQLTGPLSSANKQALQVSRGCEEFPDSAVRELERRLPLPRRRRWAGDLGLDSRPFTGRGRGAVLAITFHALQWVRQNGLQRVSKRDPSDDPPLAIHLSTAPGHCLMVGVVRSLAVLKPH